MSSLSGKLTAKGAFVDTNNDGVVDGFAHTIKGVSGWTTFSLSNGVLSLQPSGSGAGSVPGSNTQVIFNDSGSYGAASGVVYNKTFDSNSGKLTVTNLTVSGDLVVSGATTTVDSNTVTIGDNIIVLNNDETGAPSQNAGIEIERGTSANVQLLWDEANDQWDFDTFALGSVGKVYGSGSGAVYTFTSDTDTGIEHTGTNQLGLLVGNTRVLMVNSAGVSINASGASGSALYALEVTGAIEVDNILLDANTISSQNANGHLTLAPNGTGDLLVRADTVQIGDNNANATFTTYGTGDLIINTNSGTNSASITIEDGANNDVLVIPNGTGKVGIGQATPTKLLHVGGDTQIDGNLTVSGSTMTVTTTNSYISDRLITLNNNESGNGVTGTYAGFEIDRGDSGGNPNQIARLVWNESTDKFTVELETGSGTGSYNAANFIAADGAFTTASTSGLATLASASVTGDLTVDSGTLAVDSSNNRVGVNVGSPTVPLDVSGDSLFTGQMEVTGGLDSAVIVKVRNETGSAIAAGTPVYVIGYSSGQSRPLIDIADANVTSKMPVIGVLTAQLNNTSNGYIATYGRTTVASTIFTGTTPATGHAVYVSDTIGKLTVDKPTSGTTEIQFIGEVLQGGGTITLLLQGCGRTNDVPNAISALTGVFTNQVQVGSLSGGAANGMIRYNNPNLEGYVNGAWASLNTDTNTTYSVSAETVAGGANLRLTDSGAGTDDVKISSGTNTTVTRTDANTITVSATDTNTQLSTEQVQDIVGAMFGGNTETRIAVTYDDSDGTIDLVVNDMTADTQLTTEQVQDIVGAMVTGNTETNIAVTYQDGDGTIDFISTDTNTTYSAGAGLALATTTFSLNHLGLQSLTDPNADRVAFWDDSAGAFAWLQMGTGLTITDTTLNASSVSEVFKTISVSGQSDVVADAAADTLTLAAGTNVTITTTAGTDTITFASTDTNTQLSTEQVQDIVGAMFSGNTETRIAATYEDGDGTIDLVVNDMTANDDVSIANLKTRLAGGFGSNAVTIGDSDDVVTIGNDLVITGDLTVSGATTTVNTATLNVADNIMVLNSDVTGTPSENAGIEVERGSSDNVAIRWSESNDRWELTNDGSTYSAIGTSSATGTVTSVAGSAGAGISISGSPITTAGTLTITNTDLGSSQNIFKTIAVSGQSNVVADSNTDTLTFAAGSNVTITTTAGTDTVTIASADTNTQLSQEQVEDYVAGVVTAGSNISVTYNDAGGTLTLASTDTTYTASTGLALGGGAFSLSHLGIESLTDPNADRILFWDDSEGAVKFLSAGSNLSISGTTLSSTDTNTQLTTEQVQDIVGGMVTGNTETNIAVTYQDGDGTIDFVSTDTTYSAGTGLALAGTTFNVTGLTTSEIAAGSILISSDSFSDVDNQVMSAAAINDRIQSFSYITNSVTSLASLTTVGPGTGTLTVQDDLTVTGDLIVSGTTTTVNTATLNIADNIVVLNNDETGTPSQNAGIEIERGTSTNVLVRWNETSDRWEFTNDGSTYYNIPLSTEYTANVGDITGVTAGTGLSGGGTSGGVTLNVSTGAVSDGAATIPTGDHVYDFVTGLGYTTNTGDITGVTAGVGLSGGGSSGGVTLTLDMSELTDMTQAVNSAQDELIILDNGADRRKLISEIPLSAFNNDSAFITNTVSGNFTVDTTTLHVDSSNNRVGIGTTSPSVSLESTGTIKGSILESTNHVKVGGLSGSAAAGMIRWSGSNFEGYTGSAWKALDVQSAGANLDAGVAGQIVIYGSGGSTAVGDAQLTYNSTDDILLVGSTYFGGDEATNASLANAAALATLSLPKATYRSIKAVVSIKDTTNTEYQSSEILVTHNGTNATYTTYGEIFTGAAAIGTVTADISGSNMRILFTNGQGGTINATAKVSWQAIPV